MKNKLLKLPIVITLLLFLSNTCQILAQTNGTFTLTLTTTSTGTPYSPKHLIAIWIENNTGTFIKTKLLQSSNSNLDHLATWTGKSGSNVVDATTGATLSTHGQITVVWNGTDVNGTLVPDGTYNVWVEMAWAASLTTGKTTTSFQFTKGATTFHSTPANMTNFTGITLDWTPSSTLIKSNLESANISVYPNPSSEYLNLEFKKPLSGCNIKILDVNGKEVYNEYLQSVSGLKTIQINKLTAGVYFVSIQYGNKNINYRLVKKK